jgi:hypothetical protein
MATITARAPTQAEKDLFKKIDSSKLPQSTVIITPEGVRSTTSGYVSGGSSSVGGTTKKKKKTVVSTSTPGITVVTGQAKEDIMSKLRLEAIRRAEIQRAQQQAQTELRRIEQERQRLLQTGGTYSSQRVGDSVIQRTRKNGNIIEKNVNLRTGEIQLREYKDGQMVGGVDRQGIVGKGETISIGEKKEEKTKGEIRPAERTKRGMVSESVGLGKLSSSINNYRDLLRTKALRKKITPGEEALLLASGFTAGLVDTFSGVLDLPQSLFYLASNPKEILNIPANLRSAGANFGYILQTSTGEGLAYVGGSIVGIKGTNSAFNFLKKAGNFTLNKLNPKFLGNVKAGQTINVKVTPTKTVKVKVVSQMPKQKLVEQINQAGKRVNAISSQADDFFNFLKKNRAVRKPIPGEVKFKPVTKKLLAKFDSGKITRKELYQLDAMLRIEGTKGLLERSFFADPTGKIRPSRLGITTEKSSLMDYLSGDVTFKRARPQLFLFDDIKIQNFPKNLKQIATKIKAGKVLTKAEANKLLQWQLKQTGKFKPLGFVSGESEITLAPGEILRKVKKVGVVNIQGKNVPIWKVEVFKPAGTTKTLLTKAQKGILTNAERIKLKTLLKKQTGINYGSSYIPGAKYINIKFIGYNTLGRLATSFSRRGVSSSRVINIKSSLPRRTVSRTSVRRPVSRTSVRRHVSRTSPRKPVSRTSPRSPVSRTSPRRTVSRTSPRSPVSRTSPRSPVSRTSPRRTVSRTSPRSPVSRTKLKESVPRLKLSSDFKRESLQKAVPTYYVKIKRKGKIVNLTPRPLTLQDARDFLAYKVDNTLSRSAWFEPLGKRKNVVRVPKEIRGYYNKVSRKLRPYKIRVGKKVGIRMGYIEKNKYIRDTSGEKRGLQVSRYNSKKRKITPEQRKILLNRLKKARAVRMRNLKRK